jgi:hypothetical protein
MEHSLDNSLIIFKNIPQEPHLVLLANLFWLGLNATPSVIIRLLAPEIKQSIFTTTFDADIGPATTLLELVVYFSEVDTLKLLLDNQVDVRANGRALFASVDDEPSRLIGNKYPLGTWTTSRSEKLELLIKHGADPNQCNMGLTALQFAVKKLSYGAVKTLLEAGADPNRLGDQPDDSLARPCRLMTPLAIIRYHLPGGGPGLIRLENLLMSYGAVDNVRDKVGEWSPQS